MMDMYYPNTVWVAVPQAIYEQVDDYKRQHALAGWEQALATRLEEPAGRGGETNHGVTENTERRREEGEREVVDDPVIAMTDATN